MKKGDVVEIFVDPMKSKVSEGMATLVSPIKKYSIHGQIWELWNIRFEQCPEELYTRWIERRKQNE